MIYLIGVALLFLFRFPSTPVEARTILASSSEAAINTRSAGLPIEFAADFPRFLQWILIGPMMIGPAPGGARPAESHDHRQAVHRRVTF